MSGDKLFTTWFTSSADELDHAVTDEEFAVHRPEPKAVCGAVVALMPMTCPPRGHCLRCAAFLRARESLRDFGQRLKPHRHRRPGLVARLLRRHTPADVMDSPGVVPTRRHHGGEE